MRVTVEGLVFRRGRRRVLDIPALEFIDGQTTALVGPNGSGKSTLLRLVAALERPDAGSVFLGDRRAGPAEARESVAFAFQQAVFLSGSVRKNMEMALALRGVRGSERATRIAEAAAACGIEPLLHRDALRLSGGEAQRANLARALSLRAPVTLLDEPLSGLDAPSRRQLLHDLPLLLRRFATTTIVVTHDRDEALRLSDSMAVLIEGTVRASGPRADVYGNPPDIESAAFMGYMILPSEGGFLAIAPRGLRHGPGDHCFEMHVDEVIDLGVRREAWGTVAGVRTSVGLPAEGPAPGRTLVVSASNRALKRFGKGEGRAADVH
ncbi:MAG: ABC transporter ATP-binding protein [Dehalococcoidia bacterium]|nr:ABC transporter ATP-binding protein [Dehalococcoidia bacterium]